MNTRSYVPTPRAPRGAVRRLAALAVALGALAALVLGTAAPASAHAALIRTDPAAGSVVQTAPQRVVLTFSEGVLLSADSLRVLDPRGANVASDQAQHASRPGLRFHRHRRAAPGTGRTARTPWPGRRCRRTATRSPARSPSRSARPRRRPSTCRARPRSAAEWRHALRRRPLLRLRRVRAAGRRLRSSCPCAGRAAPCCAPCSGWSPAAGRTLVGATIALLMLRGPYVNGSGLGDVFDLGVHAVDAGDQTGRGAGLPAAAARRGGGLPRRALRQLRQARGPGRTRRPGLGARHRRRCRGRRDRRHLGDGRARLGRHPAPARDAASTWSTCCRWRSGWAVWSPC